VAKLAGMMARARSLEGTLLHRRRAAKEAAAELGRKTGGRCPLCGAGLGKGN